MLNYAENVAAHRYSAIEDGERVALIAHRVDGSVERLTRSELSDRVRALATMLRALGVSPGDRIAAVVANSPEAIVAALASAAVGATFSSATPDMTLPALLSRFEQLAPDVLMASIGPAGRSRTEPPRSCAGASAGSPPRCSGPWRW